MYDAELQRAGQCRQAQIGATIGSAMRLGIALWPRPSEQLREMPVAQVEVHRDRRQFDDDRRGVMPAPGAPVGHPTTSSPVDVASLKDLPPDGGAVRCPWLLFAGYGAG